MSEIISIGLGMLLFIALGGAGLLTSIFWKEGN